MMLIIQIAKFKFCQYQMRAVSPNLMLAKLPTILYVQIIAMYHYRQSNEISRFPKLTLIVTPVTSLDFWPVLAVAT